MDSKIYEQNHFYSSISKYYSSIFPYNPVQFQFINNNLDGVKGKSILDIGCATGELAFQLASAGAKVYGIDLNEDLLKQAQKKKNHPNIQFQKGDMLKLTEQFDKDYFDVVICFGNTLVHLQEIVQVGEMLKGTYNILKSGGDLFLQLLNYDFILENRIEDLPLIENDSIKFIRKYIFTGSSTIRFNTQLMLKKEGELISNVTLLLALGSQELKSELEKAGFHSLNLYADFKQNPFGGHHLPLIVQCKK